MSSGTDHRSTDVAQQVANLSVSPKMFQLVTIFRLNFSPKGMRPSAQGCTIVLPWVISDQIRSTPTELRPIGSYFSCHLSAPLRPCVKGFMGSWVSQSIKLHCI